MMEEFVEAEEATELDVLAEKITAAIETSVASGVPQPTFMLTEPLSLTVKKKKDGNYSKRPHTGGEDFKVVRCYAGKRGKLIYAFKSVSVADYAEMEMEEAQAKKVLSGFEAWLKIMVGFELDRERREAQEKASLAAERSKLADREVKYAEQGFGSW